MTWLPCDYGEVLCLPQPDADRAVIEAAGAHTVQAKHRQVMSSTGNPSEPAVQPIGGSACRCYAECERLNASAPCGTPRR
jgi:hypothetical protein